MGTASVQAETSLQSLWQPPQEGITKVNVDAAFAHGQATLGVVLRTSTGEVLRCVVTQQDHILDAMHSEMLAIKFGLECVKNQNLSHLILESDCLLAVQ